MHILPGYRTNEASRCPVCQLALSDLGPPQVQESHVKHCLEGGAGKPPQTAKYLVYKLPAESSLIGTECVICLEEFLRGSTVARLSCLCSFHNGEIVCRSRCPHTLIVSPSSLPVVMAATRTELPGSCPLGKFRMQNMRLYLVSSRK